MLAKQMRDVNNYHKAVHPSDWQTPWAEQDIRFAEYLGWLKQQDQKVQDAVTLAMHLTVAYQTKFSPLDHPPVDDEVLARVEEAQKRLGVDFIYA